ncbi:right-handed parallel beta-helix repeat-containing protein [Butyrivibrio sp. VCD2006]|uniref:right-handed parallel beta-helix repeat-containing protein n=1 Tax=Butyrivibrio sp. VCD2006 TaxID=1280664 RepID=UPI00041481AC|nr:right-handed parallel beta-helix repeat-containing protein [Butyrivibrio sp. VCD2006]
MIKRLSITLSLMLACMMILGTTSFVSKAEGTSYTVSSGEELRTLSHEIVTGIKTPGTITLSQDITITAPIWLSSDTTLDLGGHTLSGNTGKSMLFTDADYGNNVGGFEKYSNITIMNGTIKKIDSTSTGMVIFGHANNLNVTNVTFTGAQSNHMLEFGACKKVNVTGCTFKDGIYKDDKDLGTYEALSFDIAGDHFSVAPIDYTPCEDVTISGCTFNNVRRALGAHRIEGNNLFKNMTVKGCTFTNITGTAIETVAWQDALIDGNTLNGVAFGVDCRVSDQQISGSPSAYDTRITISNNKINLNNSSGKNPCGIRISGIGNTKLSGYTVTNNEIKGPHAYAIHAENVRNSTVSGTTSSGAATNGIRVEKCDGVTVSGNKIDKSKSHGIAVISSENDIIKENTVTNTKAHGIFIQESKGTVISRNTIKKVKKQGISVYKKSEVAEISENTIVKPKSNGIDVQDKKSKVLVTFGNKITKPGQKPYGGYGKYFAADSALLTLKKGKTVSVNTFGQKGKTKCSSENSSVATVDKSGKVSAKGKGTTVLTLKRGKFSAKIKVTVK